MTELFSLLCVARVRAHDVAEASSIYLQALLDAGLESPSRWSRADAKWHVARSLESALRAIRQRPGDPPATIWERSGVWGAGVRPDPDDEPGIWYCDGNLIVRDRDVPAGLAKVSTALRAMATHGHLVRAFVERENGGVMCVPEVPFAGFNAHVVVLPRERIALGFDNPEDFLSAGWTQDRAGDLLFLERGIEATSHVAYLRDILPHQWAMARAARPGLTRYYLPTVEPDELAIYKSGEPRLEVVGYVATAKTVEFSCVLQPGDHLQGWEVFNILKLIKEGKTREGYEVAAVRVVFFERWMAEQEKRPLLDMGAQVYHEADSGDLVQIA